VFLHYRRVLCSIGSREQVLSSAALCAMQSSPAKTDREYWQRVMPKALAEHDKQVRHHAGSVPALDIPALPRAAHSFEWSEATSNSRSFA